MTFALARAGAWRRLVRGGFEWDVDTCADDDPQISEAASQPATVSSGEAVDVEAG